MPLVVDQLSLWTIGLKWAGLDPNRLWLRIPASAKDNFSTLLEAILNQHLDCMTLATEKYAGDDPEIAGYHIHHWLADVYAGIQGQKFNRKLLRHAVIDRGAFQDWCERRTIPLPEFWFPPGWTEYRWPEEDSPEFAQSEVTELLALPLAPGESVAGREPPSVSEAPPTGGEDQTLRWRDDQRRRVACQVIAESLWKANPTMTISAMSKHELILEHGQGKYYVPETIYDWIKVVAPSEVREKRGRPRKENPSRSE